jgi:hypothetical protein
VVVHVVDHRAVEVKNKCFHPRLNRPGALGFARCLFGNLAVMQKRVARFRTAA